MPFYQAIFGDHFRFLHVIRDGRDVAYGDNQMQFWMLCEKHYSASFCDRTKTDHHVASMQFWQDVNIHCSSYSFFYPWRENWPAIFFLEN